MGTGRNSRRERARSRTRGRTTDLLLVVDPDLGIFAAIHAGASRTAAVYSYGIHRLLRTRRVDAAHVHNHSGPCNVFFQAWPQRMGEPVVELDFSYLWRGCAKDTSQIG